MSPALIAALFCTVLLLMVTGYFLLGSVPLLVLKHDTPLDSSFVRSFFNIYYKAAMVTAGATSVSYAFAEELPFAAVAAALVLMAFLLRRKVLPAMDAYGARIRGGSTGAIPGFRRTHLTAILVNLAQLVLIVWSLTLFSMK